MKRSLDTLVLAGLILGLGAGCATTNNLYSSLVAREAGMGGVDRLLTYVEHVHVDTELSQDKAGAALDALHEMVSRDFSGDPLVAYGAFVEAVDACEAQAASLAENVEGMKATADVVFEAWAHDLESYSSTEMRLRSHERMDKSKMMYRDIVLKVEPAHKHLTEYCSALRDHAFFLSHDFNAAAIASLEPDLRRLGLQSSDLMKELQATMDSLESYIRATSLPGVVGSEEEAQAKPLEKAPARSGGVPPLR